jgi:GTP 3',8-cyclase
LSQLVADLWVRRHDRYSEQRGEHRVTHNQPKVEMSFIGG